uniref:Ig-like domain-containing protein n=1 Tax=Pygocentrus nattereri TaxID=42514 RepID=A0AAR2L7Z9_PYGNA
MLLIFIASAVTFSAAEFSVFVPNGSVSERKGSSAVLPCGLTPALNAKMFDLRWYKNDYNNPVLLYKDLKVQENPGDAQYRGRVSLIGELDKGNVSLRLENLTLADGGEYVCFVKSDIWYEKASVNLIVRVLGSFPLFSLAEFGDQVNVSCASTGWSPKPTLTWRDKRGRELATSHIYYKTGTGSQCHALGTFHTQAVHSISFNFHILCHHSSFSNKLNYLFLSEKLTVDPDTRHRSLTVTRDGTVGVYFGKLSSSKSADTVPPFPPVLSKEGFSSGQKYWEVTVNLKTKCKLSWCVGVTQTLPSEETLTALCYEEHCGIYPSTDPHTQIPAEGHVKTLGLILDFKHKTLSFINVDKESHLHTFRMNSDQCFLERGPLSHGLLLILLYCQLAWV